MSAHLEEYRAKLALVSQQEMGSLVAHWELGEVFARYGEPIRDIAKALEVSFSTVQRHLLIAKIIPTREDLDRLLQTRPDIRCWQDLLVWADARPPEGKDQRQDQADRGGAQGGIVLTVPASVIKALADQGCNAREVITLFWQNVSPHLLITIAYPDRPSRAA